MRFRKPGISVCFLSALLCSFVLTFSGAVSAQTSFAKPSSKSNAAKRAGEANGPPVINWRVANPFRFFTDEKLTDVHRLAFESLSEEERASPLLAIERLLSGRHARGWAAGVVDQTCWDQDSYSHRCKGRKNYVQPDEHIVVARLDNLADANVLTCTWKTAPRGGKRLRGEVIRKPCGETVRLKTPYPRGMSVEVEIGGRRVAKTKIKVQDIFIVGLGDSFASGEGNPDVPVRFSDERAANYGASGGKFDFSGYPARVGSWKRIGDGAFTKSDAVWLDRACHRSLYSHQTRAALQLAIEDPHRAVTFVGLACSGAETIAGLFLRYKGNEWVPNPPKYSQISEAARAQCGARSARSQDLPEAYHIGGKLEDLRGGLVLEKCDRRHARKIDLLFLSVGGNDIGFARLLANAVLADKSMLRWLGGWIGRVHGQRQARSALALLDERYKSINRAFHNILHIPWRESDRIILTGYPSMALLSDGETVCPDGAAGMDVVPVFTLNSKRARESLRISDKLHAKMRASARRHSWSFVDTHSRQFLGRGICAGNVSNASSIAEDLRLPRKSADGDWAPFRPSEYRPYASRSRWFRTPNDAFMTANFHVSATLLRQVLKLESLSRVQVLLAATYSGAFHPTAEGQAVIGDAVVKKAREVLRRYQQ